MDATNSAEWESWTSEVVQEEVVSFVERAQKLMGLSEEQLTRQLGSPSEKSPGRRLESATRELILQADCDLLYFDLLPHVVVSFAIAKGIIADVGFMPKWRRCPPAFASDLRGAYAPE